MKSLPNLAAQTMQAASSFAKFAGDQAMERGHGSSRGVSDAYASAESCVRALIELETVLAESDDLPLMAERIADALAIASSTVRAAGVALKSST